MTSNALLAFDRVSVAFGGLQVLKDVEFNINPQEILSLIGPNGAGKTTVFNIMTGVYKPVSGRVLFKGENIAHKRTHDICKKGITRTFQNIRLFKDLTVLDNVLISKHLQYSYSMASAMIHAASFLNQEKKLRQEASELLELFSLSHRQEELARNLPYGDQRKLEIVRALAAKSTLILLDEPAAGMNDQETQSLMKLIQTVRDLFKVTVLLIEHDMRLVMGISDRIVVLHHGVVISQGQPARIKNDPKVIEAYLGKSDE